MHYSGMLHHMRLGHLWRGVGNAVTLLTFLEVLSKPDQSRQTMNLSVNEFKILNFTFPSSFFFFFLNWLGARLTFWCVPSLSSDQCSHSLWEVEICLPVGCQERSCWWRPENCRSSPKTGSVSSEKHLQEMARATPEINSIRGQMRQHFFFFCR